MIVSAALAIALLQSSDSPSGFVPVSERAALDGRSEEDTPDYQISLLDGRMRVESWAKWLRREGAEAKTRPASEPSTGPFLKLGMAKLSLKPGHGLKVLGGWLSAWHFGEFGGGIVHVSDPGGEMTLVTDVPTHLIAQTSRGLFAEQGLAHMGSDFGTLIEVLGPEGGWRVRHVTDLHHSSRGVVQEGDRFLFTHDRFVSTLETDGRQHEIYRTWEEIDAMSMVRHKSGDVWIGARRAILRLRPKPNGEYSAQWFAPSKSKPKPKSPD